MSKKGAVGVSTFVKLAAVVIVLVLFIIIIPHFTNIFKGIVKTGECQWDMLFSALMTTASFGKGSSPECGTVNISIKMEDLYGYQVEAAQRMQVYRNEPAKYKAIIAEGFGVQEDSNEYYDKQIEWALNKVVADKMLWCWKRVWKGNLPVFDQWWNLIDWTFFGAGTPEYTIEQLQTLEYTNVGVFTTYGPPTFCIICARLKFDKDIRMKFGSRSITSLNAWMASNPAPDSKKSYLEELLEGQTVASPMFIPQYSYEVNEPFAIVYKRINPHKIAAVVRWLGSLPGITEEAQTVNQLALAQYDKIVVSREKGGEGCFPPVVD